MRTAPGLVATGVRAGVLDAIGTLQGRVSLVDRSRSNLVHQISVDGVPVAYVKQQGAPLALEHGDSLAHEERVLRLLDDDLVPEVLDVSDEECLWTAALPGMPWPDALASATDVAVLAAALGRALAHLHLLPLPEHAPVATVPWPVAMAQGQELPAGITSAPEGSEPAAVVAQGRIGVDAAALARAAGRWAGRSWVHGDISASNLVVEGLGRAGAEPALARPTVRLLDLEDAGAGEPSWDVVLACRSLTDHLPGDTGERARAALLTAYHQAGGPGTDDPDLAVAARLSTDFRRAAMALQARIRTESTP